MIPSQFFPVVVAGGGPCGLMTALILARSGVRCVLLERHGGLIDHPKAMSITGRSLEIFRSLHLDVDLMAGSLDMNGRDLAIWCQTLVGEEWGRTEFVSTSDIPYRTPGIHCPQTVTERVLLDALENEENASILFDHELVSFEVKPSGGLELSVRRAMPSTPLTIECQYLVAADGAASPIRRWLGIHAEGPGDQGHFLNIYFRANYGKHLKHRKAVLYQVLDRESFEAFVSVNGDDLWLVHHFLQPGDSPADFPSEKLASIISKASGLPSEPVEVLGVSPWVMSPKVAHRFAAPPIFLTGDASARLSPTGGLGMNTGLQSAHNLAWKLAAVVHGAPASILDSYEIERRPVALESFKTTDAFRKEVFEIVDAGVSGDFDRVKSALATSVRSGGTGEMLGLHYPSGAIIPDEGSGVTALGPGDCIPSIPLEGDDESLSVQHWFGTGWVLVVCGDSDAWNDAAEQAVTYAGDLMVRHVGDEPRDALARAFGIMSAGAVLVRPDGFAAWVCPELPENPTVALNDVLSQIFNNGKT